MTSLHNKRLRIGAFHYTVEIVEELVSDFEKVDGELSHGSQTIRLEEKHSYPYKITTLFHEVSHALMEQSGLRHQLDHEAAEAVCDLVGYGMFQVLLDNPWIVQLFLDDKEVKNGSSFHA